MVVVQLHRQVPFAVVEGRVGLPCCSACAWKGMRLEWLWGRCICLNRLSCICCGREYAYAGIVVAVAEVHIVEVAHTEIVAVAVELVWIH